MVALIIIMVFNGFFVIWFYCFKYTDTLYSAKLQRVENFKSETDINHIFKLHSIGNYRNYLYHKRFLINVYVFLT